MRKDGFEPGPVLESIAICLAFRKTRVGGWSEPLAITPVSVGAIADGVSRGRCDDGPGRETVVGEGIRSTRQ